MKKKKKKDMMICRFYVIYTPRKFLFPPANETQQLYGEWRRQTRRGDFQEHGNEDEPTQ